MANSDKTILVLGATGQQGGATARELLSRGFSVRALARDPEKPAAKALAGLGAVMAKGDLEDASSVAKAMQGVHGIFSVQTPAGGVEREEREGKAVVDAAKRVGVEHVVYTSVGGAERSTGIPHFESKHRIEEHLRAAGLRTTILRPVFFMENFVTRMGPQAVGGELVLRLALSPATRLQMISVRDIGILAALAFEGREGVAGRATEIAGDELSMTEIAGAFAAVAKRPVRFEQQPIAEVEKMSSDLGRMFRWFEAGGYAADVAALRRLHPGLMTLGAWLALGSWKPPA